MAIWLQVSAFGSFLPRIYEYNALIVLSFFCALDRIRQPGTV
jgi:hypothetical protein